MTRPGWDFWTPERMATAKAMLAEGVMTPIIAKKLGCTKNALVGKARRERWVIRSPGSRAHTLLTQSPRQRQFTDALARKRADPDHTPGPTASGPAAPRHGRARGGRGVSNPMAPLGEVGRPVRTGSCQWIYGHVGIGKDGRYCGEPTESGRPYCREHCLKAYIDYTGPK